MVPLLLRAGAKPDAQGPGLGTPLRVATENGHAVVMEALLPAGARAEGSLLHAAARHGAKGTI